MAIVSDLPLPLWALAPSALALYLVLYGLYNLYLHPLARYPGPLLMRATRLGQGHLAMRGTLPFDLLDLHKKYGPVVRIAPDELAYQDPAAWRDIMGHRAAGEGEFEKSQKFYQPVEGMPTDVVRAQRDEHSKLRRTMAHGFSERAMRDQQGIIGGYVDMFIEGLRREAAGGKKVDVAAWYNFATFDVIGDLAFGESFGCLESGEYHPWVKAIFQMARTGTVLQTATHYPILMKLLMAMAPKSLMEERLAAAEMTKAKLRRRMEAGKERPDLIEGLLKKKEEWGLTLDSIQANSGILVIAGSETTATLLSGVTFLLLTNKFALDKLTAEIRNTFKSEDEIDFVSVSALPYLLACLDEALRMYPPVPIGLPRVTPKGGATICGQYVPEGTIVAIHQWAMYHSDHFKDPFQFHPERWLGDPAFASDNKDAFQPFHIGSRNCLGRNLAYIEMRIMLTRLLWNFDMRIAEESVDWMSKQRVFNLWEKGPLMVYLTPVAR